MLIARDYFSNCYQKAPAEKCLSPPDQTEDSEWRKKPHFALQEGIDLLDSNSTTGDVSLRIAARCGAGFRRRIPRDFMISDSPEVAPSCGFVEARDSGDISTKETSGDEKVHAQKSTEMYFAQDVGKKRFNAVMKQSPATTIGLAPLEIDAHLLFRRLFFAVAVVSHTVSE